MKFVKSCGMDYSFQVCNCCTEKFILNGYIYMNSGNGKTILKLFRNSLINYLIRKFQTNSHLKHIKHMLISHLHPQET